MTPEGDAIVAATDSEKITLEEFIDLYLGLLARARASGINPMQAMVKAHAREGMTVVDRMFGALEGGTRPKG